MLYVAATIVWLVCSDFSDVVLSGAAISCLMSNLCLVVIALI